MRYHLSLGAWDRVFAVPSDLVDKHIILASGSQIKVLLYFLRHAGENLEDQAIAKALKMKPETVQEGLEYWVAARLLDRAGALYHPAEEKQTTEEVASPPASQPVVPNRMPLEVSRNKHTLPPLPGQEEAVRRIASDKDLQNCCEQTEKILSRPLTPTDLRLILWCREMLSLPEDVLCLLFYYYRRLGKTDTAILKEAAADWWEREINTYAAAESYLSELERSRETEARMKKLLEWGEKSFTQKQKEMIHLWTEVWKFSDGVILLALQKAKDAEVKILLPYMHKMLQSWYERKLFTPEAIEEADNAFRVEKEKAVRKKTAPKETKKNTSYALSDIESMLDDIPGK